MRSYKRPRRWIGGFSLLELMIAITVLSVLLFIGIPGFQSFFESARERAAVSMLASAVNLARSEAVTRGAGYEVCIGAACNQADFTGIRVREDKEKDPSVIREWEVAPSVSYVASQDGKAAGLRVRFSPLGLALDTKGGQQQMQAPLEVKVYDTSAGRKDALVTYCITVTGSLMKQECGS